MFVTKYGVEMEANPIMRWVLSHGLIEFIAVKGVILGFWLRAQRHLRHNFILIHVLLILTMLPVVIMGVIVATGV